MTYRGYIITSRSPDYWEAHNERTRVKLTEGVSAAQVLRAIDTYLDRGDTRRRPCHWCGSPTTYVTGSGGWPICDDCWDRGEDGYRP